MSERFDPFGRPIEGDHPWARPADDAAGLPGGFLPPEAPATTPVSSSGTAAPVIAPERPTAQWAPVGLPEAPRKTAAPSGVEFASWGSRVGAYLIDVVIELVVAAILGGVAGAAIGGGDTATGLVVVGIAFLVAVLYPTVLLAIWNGQTVGKRLVGLRVVGEGGATMDWGRAAMREIVMRGLVIGLIGTITVGIVSLLDVLWPLWDKENRALHDHGADTWVVRVRAAGDG